METGASVTSAPTVAAANELRCGDIHVHDTTVSLWEDVPASDGSRFCTNDDRDRVFAAVYREFKGILGRMRFHGWKVVRCPETAKRHKCIAHNYYVATKGDLCARIETSGRTITVEFYQELNVSNPHGGRYDFNKFDRVSRFLRLQCAVEMTRVVEKLVERGYTLPRHVRAGSVAMDILRLAEDRLHDGDPLAAFNERWDGEWERKRGTHRFERDATGWPTLKEYGQPYNNDRDGRPILNGTEMYYRDRGRLLRGTVYTHMNTSWRVVHGAAGRYGAHASCYELFHCEHPEQEKRRLVPKQEERLRAELDKALKAKQYDRVATLGRVLARLFPGGTDAG